MRVDKHTPRILVEARNIESKTSQTQPPQDQRDCSVTAYPKSLHWGLRAGAGANECTNAYPSSTESEARFATLLTRSTSKSKVIA